MVAQYFCEFSQPGEGQRVMAVEQVAAEQSAREEQDQDRKRERRSCARCIPASRQFGQALGNTAFHRRIVGPAHRLCDQGD